MKPNTKRLLATLVVAIVGAILPILTQTGQEALPAMAMVISSLSSAIAYYVRAWGTKEGVIDELLKAPGKTALDVRRNGSGPLDEDVDFPEDDYPNDEEDEDEKTDPGFEPRA